MLSLLIPLTEGAQGGKVWSTFMAAQGDLGTYVCGGLLEGTAMRDAAYL